MSGFLLTLALPEPAPTLLSEAGNVRVLGRVPDAEELVRELDGVDVLCSQLRDRLTADVLAHAPPRLRAVCNYAVGYDNVDLEEATRRGVWVTNTPDVLTTATADCTMGLMLAVARRLGEGDRAVRAGRFEGWRPDYMLGLDLHGATLALVGFGRIARAVAERAGVFGMGILYTDRSGATPPAHLRDARRVSLLQALGRADVISLHAPLTADTHHLIDDVALRAMKRSALLINTARGALIDEHALVDALREGRIGGAGLDVYEREPQLAPGLGDCPNTVLSPHLGSATHRTRSAMARVCAVNAVAAARGEVPPNAVNAPRVAGNRAWTRPRRANLPAEEG